MFPEVLSFSCHHIGSYCYRPQTICVPAKKFISRGALQSVLVPPRQKFLGFLHTQFCSALFNDIPANAHWLWGDVFCTTSGTARPVHAAPCRAWFDFDPNPCFAAPILHVSSPCGLPLTRYERKIRKNDFGDEGPYGRQSAYERLCLHLPLPES
jgi:hypothetical protein